MTKIAALSVYTTDLERSKTFYTEVLGFQVAEEHEGIIKLEHEPKIVLCAMATPPPHPAYPAGVVFGIPVSDVAEMLTKVRTMGYETIHQKPEPFPWGRFVAVRDPDGNAVELLELD